MFKEYRKISNLISKVAIGTILSVSLGSLSACSGGKSESALKADDLIEQARTALDNGDYVTALNALDSIDSNYKTETQALKQSIALRPRAIILEGEAELTRLEEEYAVDSLRLDSIAMLMTHVDIPGTGGYMVAKSANRGDFLSTTGLSGRVDETGRFYMVSSVAGAGNLKHTSLTITAGDFEINSPVIDYDGELNYRVGGGELITFPAERCDSIAQFLVSLTNADKLRITFNGNGRKNITVNAAPLITAARYADLINKQRTRLFERERLNGRISLARQQSVRHLEEITTQEEQK